VIADQSTRPPEAWPGPCRSPGHPPTAARPATPRVYRRLAACHGLPAGISSFGSGYGRYVTLSSPVWNSLGTKRCRSKATGVTIGRTGDGWLRLQGRMSVGLRQFPKPCVAGSNPAGGTDVDHQFSVESKPDGSCCSAARAMSGTCRQPGQPWRWPGLLGSAHGLIAAFGAGDGGEPSQQRCWR
jgi:hypothetical protein